MPHTDSVNASKAIASQQDISVLVYRSFSWITVAVLFSYLINNYLTHWQSWPGAITFISEGLETQGLAFSLIQFAFYVVSIAVVILYILRSSDKSLRADSKVFYNITAYIIRAAFWATLFIGCFDILVSFLKFEKLLLPLVGSELTELLSQKHNRGQYLHMPLIAISFVIAFFTRGLGFPWLALLVVVVQLCIVLAGGIYSYEQPMFPDLVRFWYAALFLFASAYTLIEEGHVRVDLVYAGLSKVKKGLVNALGSVLLGMSLCWVILFYGLYDKFSIINTVILSSEVTQQGDGMKVKYWMAAFLAVFAVSMLIQFAGYFLEGLADFRNEPDEKNKEQSEKTGAVIS